MRILRRRGYRLPRPTHAAGAAGQPTRRQDRELRANDEVDSTFFPELAILGQRDPWLTKITVSVRDCGVHCSMRHRYRDHAGRGAARGGVVAGLG
jgi:hypothetical protein